MSTLSVVSDNEADLPRLPPSELGSLLTSWWLTIGFSILALLAMIPMAPRPLTDGGAITRTGWLTFVGLAILFLAAGVFLGSAIRSAKPYALRMSKLALIIAVTLVVAVVAGVLVLASGDKSPGGGAAQLLGPTPLLAVILLAFVVIVPAFFAILAFSFAGTQPVVEWFNPPQETVSYTAEEAAGGAWEGAAQGEAGAAVAEVGEGAVVSGVEAPGAEHFDDVMEQELSAAEQETVAYQPGPATDAPGGRPTMIADQQEMAAMDAEAGEVVEVGEGDEDLPSAEPEASDATQIRPVETWDVGEEDEDKKK